MNIKHQSQQPITDLRVVGSTRAEYLVYGYIKHIILNKTIPIDINNICLAFIDANDFELRPLKCEKALKKGRTKTKLFIWGKACPPNLFPSGSDQLTPYRVNNLSKKKIWSISAAKEGEHCFGLGQNHWCFVWGQTEQTGALGLGTNSRKTTPFLIRALSKQKVQQTCCSALHSLCITDKMIIYGWGSKMLTLLDNDALKPEPLNYINGKGLKHLRACNTHSLAWKTNYTHIYSFGKCGTWLGYGDTDANKTLVKIQCGYGIKMADCSSEYTLIISNFGKFGAFGINKQGRMGIGKNVECSSEIIWNGDLNNIVLCSAGINHSGFVDNAGFVYTTGLGDNFCLGHGNEETLWKPKMVDAIKNVQVCKMECVNHRTFVVTPKGNLITWGKEVVTGRVHDAPFMYDYFKHVRIYDVCGAKEFNVVIGKIELDSQPNLEQELYIAPPSYLSKLIMETIANSYDENQSSMQTELSQNYVAYGGSRVYYGGNQSSMQTGMPQNAGYGGYFPNNTDNLTIETHQVMDPFNTSNITLQCQNCGHLDLYSVGLTKNTQKKCNKCTNGVMIYKNN